MTPQSDIQRVVCIPAVTAPDVISGSWAKLSSSIRSSSLQLYCSINNTQYTALHRQNLQQHLQHYLRAEKPLRWQRRFRVLFIILSMSIVVHVRLIYTECTLQKTFSRHFATVQNQKFAMCNTRQFTCKICLLCYLVLCYTVLFRI